MTHDTSLHDLARLTERCSEASVNSVAGVEGLCRLAVRVTGAMAARVILGTGSEGRVLGEFVDGSAEPVLDLGEGDPMLHVAIIVSGTQFATLLVEGASVPLTTSSLILEDVADAARRLFDLEMARERIFDLGEQVATAEHAFAEAAGNLVHDVNNPLAAASMSLEIARDEVPDGLVAQLLDRAVSSTTRMKGMVVDLLAFSARPEQGHAVVGEVLTPLVEVWDEVVPGAVTLTGGETEVPMSARDLELVLVALLDNAAKFASDEVPARVRLRAEQSPQRVLLEVADAGRGVEANDRDRIFTPTVRLDRTIPGLGMGLATVRRLVQHSGGEVAVHDSDLGGLLVRMVWPVGEGMVRA